MDFKTFFSTLKIQKSEYYREGSFLMIWEGLEGHISYFKVLLKNDIIRALKISKIHDTYL